MDKVKAMQTFVRIVQANSFTKAAETLELPRAALTATLKNLEAFLGTQLLQRTTRRLSLTPDGAEYYRQCVEILSAIEAAEQALRGPEARRPRGKLRVDLPGALGRHLVVPRLAEFHHAYPEVQLAISLTHRLVDLTQEGMDCVLRVGQLQDSSMVGRQLGTMRFVTCAAPSYLERHGTPLAVEELERHQCVVHFSGRTGRPFEWEWMGPDGAVRSSAISGPVAVNDADAYISCALQGLGLVQAASYQARPHLAAGRLVEVLPQAVPTPMPVSLLYPQGRMASPKLSVFAAWLAGLFEQDPDLRL
ncbi:LysR family transcriptional regulator [Oxalobacteraceae bacterium A2-2]